ncbi:hypothetical protein CSAL01_07904 [Colletotrichum salicis]|uniref:Uncharacterized protein n=1 Tax=Colletotrichum salicis TaxID=1209931 RepID=A0A135V896_9PEZI|nr:hypothetical protein CSAL01_07904 [Colletotrichum salicis]
MAPVWLMAGARLSEKPTAKRPSHDPRTESTESGPRPSTYIIARRRKPSDQVQHRRPRRTSPPTPPPVTIVSLEMSGELAYRPTYQSPVQGVPYYRAPPNTLAVHWTCEHVLLHRDTATDTAFRDKTVTACLSWSGASNYTKRRLASCVTRFLHLNCAASILIRPKTLDRDLHPHVGHRVGKATSQQPQKRKRLAASDRAPTPMISRILPVSSSLQLGFTVQATRHTKLATRTWWSQATTPPGGICPNPDLFDAAAARHLQASRSAADTGDDISGASAEIGSETSGP